MERGSKRKRLRAPSPAMVVACIALTVALSGASYAAATLAKNSVGTAQLKANAVNSSKVAAGSLNGSDVQDNSLSGSDINESSLAGGSITGVNAATLGGFDASDFQMVDDSPYPASDAYVMPGSNWVDRDGLTRNTVSVTYTGTAGSKTQICTTPGASTAGVAAAYAEVHLPQGAQLTGMYVDYRDDAGSTGSNGTVTMTRQPMFGSDASASSVEVLNATLGNLTAGEAGISFDLTPGDSTPGPTVGVIDNSRYSYIVQALPGTLSGVGYCALRVTYDLP